MGDVGGARYPESLVVGAKCRETGSKVIQWRKGRTVTGERNGCQREAGRTRVPERSSQIRAEGVTY